MGGHGEFLIKSVAPPQSMIALFAAEGKCWESLCFTSNDCFPLKHDQVGRGLGKVLLWRFVGKERAEAEEGL